MAMIQQLSDLKRIILQDIEKHKAIEPQGRGFKKGNEVARKEGYLQALDNVLKAMEIINSRY